MPIAADIAKFARPVATLWRSRAYLFTVTSLAVFLLGLAALEAFSAYSAGRPDLTAIMPDSGASDSDELYAKEYSAAHLALESAHERNQQAHQEMAAFADRRMAETTNSLQSVIVKAGSLHARAKDAATPKLIPNPAWNEVSLKLREVSARRKILSTRLTSEHPEMQQLDSQITELQNQLATAPEMLAISQDNPATANEFAAEQISAIRQTEGELQARQAQNAAEQTRLMEAIVTTEKEVERRTQAERVAWQRVQGVNNQRLAAEQATQILEQRRFGFERTTLGIVAILALSAGAIVTWAGNEKNHVFESVEQAQAKLPIPVVGVLSNNLRRDGRHSDDRHSAVPRWVPWVRAGAEVTLASVLVAAAVAALADHNFVGQFASDPYTCFQQTVERVLIRR